MLLFRFISNGFLINIVETLLIVLEIANMDIFT